MSEKTFNEMRVSFCHKIHIDSAWVILQRIATLSGIKPVLYDCCINSCVAYTGSFQYDLHCKFCRERRFKSDKKTPRSSFSYLPIIPQLQGYFKSPEMVDLLSYRHKYAPSSDMIRDVFDSQHYRHLCETQVVIDGVRQRHEHFSHPDDIALGICLDSYLMFDQRRKGPSATPILLQNYNLPPQLRTHLNMLICAGLIPGPKQPKNIALFLAPLEEELVTLAGQNGVETYHCVNDAIFPLHAYSIIAMGDIVAIEKLMGLRGHNSFSPCQSCNIKGIRNEIDGIKVYYLPLKLPRGNQYGIHLKGGRDPRNLIMRMHSDWAAVMENIDAAETKKRKTEISNEHGIKEYAALMHVGSVDLAASVPWDWMHLFLENDIPNLVKLWTGAFKNLDVGSEDYELSSSVWTDIGNLTKKATKTIPSCFI